MSIIQNTIYLTTPGTVVSKCKKTLKISVEGQTTTIPIHRLKSVCVFGYIRITPQVLNLCLQCQVSVHFHTQNGYLLGQAIGSGDSRYLVRKSQYAKAEDPVEAREIATIFVAGKLQNSRINLLRARRELGSEEDQKKLSKAIRSLENILRLLEDDTPSPSANLRESLDPIRGLEGIAAKHYFEVFSCMMKQQRNDFAFSNRSRRPPRDRINCLLSFIYALLRSECLTALTVAGVDPYIGWLHSTRAGRPACALDLMEEFRPHAERLALTLINRQQIQYKHFHDLEGGAIELTPAGRKVIISAWQKRKQVMLKHELFQESVFMGHVFLIQARLLSRWIRGEIPHYVPFILN